MADGIMGTYLNALYMMPLQNQVQGVKQITSWRDAQKQSQVSLSPLRDQQEQVRSLGKESSAFLTQYTSDMNTLNQNAQQAAQVDFEDTLFDEQGSVTQETLNNTADRVQNLVDNYNSTLEGLYENRDRGPGVEEQIERMKNGLVSPEDTAAIGLTQNKDGSLSLNRETLTQALSSAATSTDKQPLQRLQDIVTGPEGLTQEIETRAKEGLRESARELVGNDMQKMMQTAKQEDPLQNYASYGRSGSKAFLTNQMAAGVLMNFAV